MNKRVYGLVGISARMANWNADFTGYPKTTSNGDIFGSDKAFKYPMKKMWDDSGEKVLYIKSYKLKEEKSGVSLIPNSLKERYEFVNKVNDLSKENDANKVMQNLFSAIDVKNFGATFAESGSNISITGAVQIGQGYNIYDMAVAEEQSILSPFRDASDKGTKETAKKDEEAKNSTLGTKIVTPEAHYCYPFVINPLAYKEYKQLGFTDGYTEEDYKKFKKAATSAATAFATNAKAGCENEFALFLETDIDLYLPNLDRYVSFTKGQDKDTININIKDIISGVSSKVKKAEIYYNPLTVKVNIDIENVSYFNIFSGEEVVDEGR
ncbi:MAG: type I CRISPR-associated protein Cas7 [Proteocatella sp.]